MRLRIAQKTIDNWADALKQARNREIGGILFGEHVDDDDFRILEATTQKTMGSSTAFHRDSEEAKRELGRLFQKYGDDPERFNYLGEWHSHPNAPALPSSIDELTMQKLLNDPKSEVHFLVLLINRLNNSQIELSATSYLTSGERVSCNIVVEKGDKQS